MTYFKLSLHQEDKQSYSPTTSHAGDDVAPFASFCSYHDSRREDNVSNTGVRGEGRNEETAARRS